MSSCLECLRGFHVICGDCDCCNPNAVTVSDPLTPTPNEEEINATKEKPVYDVFDPEADWRVSEGGTRRGKSDRALKDQQSTGRKRAANLFPLERDMPCEWANANRTSPKGGGTYPVLFGLEYTNHTPTEMKA